MFCEIKWEIIAKVWSSKVPCRCILENSKRPASDDTTSETLQDHCEHSLAQATQSVVFCGTTHFAAKSILHTNQKQQVSQPIHLISDTLWAIIYREVAIPDQSGQLDAWCTWFRFWAGISCSGTDGKLSTAVCLACLQLNRFSDICREVDYIDLHWHLLKPRKITLFLYWCVGHISFCLLRYRQDSRIRQRTADSKTGSDSIAIPPSTIHSMNSLSYVSARAAEIDHLVSLHFVEA